MKNFPVLLYTLTIDIPTLSYTRSLKKLSPSGGTSLYKPLYGVPQRGLTYYWPFIEIFLPAKLSRVSESCIFNYSFVFGFLFQIQYSSCSRKMFHLLISSSHKRLLCLPMSPCFPLRLSKKWGATVKIIFMIIFKSLYLQFIFQKVACVILLIFFRFYPILKRNKGIHFSVIVFSLCCSLPFWPWLSLNWFVINPWKDSVYENHICELWVEELYEIVDHPSYGSNFCSCEKKAWKKFRLIRDSNRSAILVQRSC